MDRNIIERMIGATVLVVLVVLIAPALLDRQRDAEPVGQPVQLPEPEMRTETIYLTGSDPEREPSTWQGQATTAERGEPVEPAASNSAPAPEPAAPVPAAEPPKSKASDRPGEGWAVQLGSFSARDNADTFVATLLGEGYPSFVVSASTSSKTLYRVYAGPRMLRDEADQLARRLARAGHEGLVVSLSANAGQGG